MYSITKNSDISQPYVCEIVADTRADIEEIPADFAPGSTCVVLEDTSVWMLGNDAIWHEM
jgi:hypothetical protein